MRIGKEEGRKKKLNLFFLQSSYYIWPTQLCFTRCHFPGFLGFFRQLRRIAGAVMWSGKDKRWPLMYLFGNPGLLLDIFLLNRNQCPEASLHLKYRGVNTQCQEQRCD